MDKLAQWLDWTGDTLQAELMEAKRIVEDVRLLSWVRSQNRTQGVSPLPQLVWEKRCFLSIDNSSEPDARASSHRPHRRAGAKKWVQRFRRCWDLAMGRLPAKDLLTVDTMRSKVRFGVSEDSDPTRNRGATNRGQKTDPVWVPRI